MTQLFNSIKTNLTESKEWVLDWLAFKSFFKEKKVQEDDHGTILYICSGEVFNLRIYSYLFKYFEKTGRKIVALSYEVDYLKKYYQMLPGVERIVWHEFFPNIPLNELGKYITVPQNYEDAMALEYRGIPIGRHAVAQMEREKTLPVLDARKLVTKDGVAAFIPYLVWAVQTVHALETIFAKYKPTSVMITDLYIHGGCSKDMAKLHDINCFSMLVANKTNFYYLKRFKQSVDEDTFVSISEKTWAYLKALPMNEKLRKSYTHQHFKAYATQSWREIWNAQRGKRIYTKEELNDLLQLDGSRPCVFICPPCLWDFNVYGGNFFFKNFEEWYVHTLRLAAENEFVDWVIKIHPVNLHIRSDPEYKRQGFDCIHGSMELDVLMREYPVLPKHFRVLDADSPVSTHSCFGIMHACLTINNGIGVETASYGVPTVTPGRNHYSNRGFTVDPSSLAEYDEILRNIQSLKTTTSHQQDLAIKFAYATLYLRQFHLKAVACNITKNASSRLTARSTWRNEQEFYQSEDLKLLSDWIFNSSDEDYLGDEEVKKIWPDEKSGYFKLNPQG